MPDQAGGKLGTEQLATEQGSSRPAAIFNNAASGQVMTPWKKNMMSFLQNRAQPPQPPKSVAPGQTSKTLYGATDPGVAGGPKEVQTMQQNLAQRGATPPAPNQTVANPVASPDNTIGQVKGGSMSTDRKNRIVTVRALLKFAACMKKSLGKKKKMKKWGEADVPGVSVAAPLAAGGIGAGSALASSAISRSPYMTRVMKNLADDKQVLGAAFGRPSVETAEQVKKMVAPVERLRGMSKLRAYAGEPALAAATLAAPVWAGAAAAKRKGGAGRGAAVGAGTGAGMGTIASLIGALAARKAPGGAAQVLKTQLPRAVGAGAGIGAVGGAAGGGIQKRRRTKAQEKDKSSKKPESKKTEKAEKEAALRKVAGLGATLKGLPWAKILGGTAAGLGALAVVPPALRAANRGVEHYFDPAARQAHEFQTRMMPQMMMLNMLRGMGGYGGGGGVPPMMMQEDRDLMRHATYLQGLRSRAQTMREAFGA